MRKQIAVILSFALAAGFLVYLLVASTLFFPADGYEAKGRMVREEALLTGRDDAYVASRGLLPGEVLNLNTADEEELQRLPGIGPQLAGAIAVWREENGAFASVEELLLVPGIGEKKLDAIRDVVTVSDEP